MCNVLYESEIEQTALTSIRDVLLPKLMNGEQAESKADFIHKLSIALKEANETDYWIELLSETKYLKDAEYRTIKEDALELIRLLVSIIKSSKSEK